MFKAVSPNFPLDLPQNLPLDPVVLDPVDLRREGEGVDLSRSRTESAGASTNESDRVGSDSSDRDQSKDKRIAAQLIKEKKLEDIKNQCSELISELDSDDDPEAVVKKHISKLKEYNELKDIALGLVTMIADQRQLRTTDILEEMKVELSDELNT